MIRELEQKLHKIHNEFPALCTFFERACAGIFAASLVLIIKVILEK